MVRNRLLCVSNISLADVNAGEGGTQVYLRRLIDLLSRENDVQVISPSQGASFTMHSETVNAKEYAPTGIPSALKRGITCVQTGTKPAWWRWYSPVAADWIAGQSKEDFDAIVFLSEAASVLGYTQSGKRSLLPAVCFRHNIDAQSIRQMRGLGGVKGFVKSLYHGWLMDRFDRGLHKRFSATVANNPVDADYLRKRSPLSDIRCTPTTIEDPNPSGSVRFEEASGESRFELIFLGGLNYEPNRQAVVWFLEEVLPKARAKCSRAINVNIVGAGGEQFIAKNANFRGEGVQFHGFLLDLASIVSKADIAIVPLRFGSGVKIKTLTQLAYGLPVVSTRCGAEGLEAFAGDGLILADEASAFADAISLLVDDSTRKSHSAGARRIFETYSRDADPVARTQAMLADVVSQ